MITGGGAIYFEITEEINNFKLYSISNYFIKNRAQIAPTYYFSYV